jgi:nucleotide-binding universal stress UspA family protein
MSAADSLPSVVVGVDGSKAASNAAQWAVDEAVHRDIPLRLVYVIDPLDIPGALTPEGRLAAARAALHNAQVAAESSGKPVKIESEIVWGKPLTKLMEESRSAALVSIGSIGLNHARHGRGAVAAALAEAALCPVAVIRRPVVAASSHAGSIVADVDNAVVLRHALDEARLRAAPLRAMSVSPFGDGSPSAQAQLDRRIERWTRLYPDVQVEPAIVAGRVEENLAATDQLLVTESHSCYDLCRAYRVGCSVLAIRSSNL